MKTTKILLAVLITIALLVVARRASQRQVPVVVEKTTYGELTLTHTCGHVFKGDNTVATLDVEVSGGLLPQDATISLYYRPRATSETDADREVRVEAVTIPGQGLTYRVAVPNQGRGTEFSYRFQMEDSQGRKLAVIPETEKKAAAEQLWFRFEGARSVMLLVIHITCMFGAFLIMVLVFLTATENLKDEAVRVRLGRQTLWATTVLFIGTFPIGFWLEYQVYATYWTGIPLGRDITDSKSLLIFVYWAVMLYLLRGAAFSRNPRKDIVGPAAARWIAIIGVVISLALYLVPHSSGSF
jgi:hypothetical protein